MNERGSLKEALEKAQREREYLASENALLRQELLGGWGLSGGPGARAVGSEGSGACCVRVLESRWEPLGSGASEGCTCRVR